MRNPLRVSQLCTAEVAALCLELAGEAPAGRLLEAYLDVFSERYLDAKHHLPLAADSPASRQLKTLRAS